MELKVLKNLYNYPALFWLGITVLVWWTGLGGKDLYLLPALIFLLIYIYRIWKYKHLDITINFPKCVFGKKWLEGRCDLQQKY